MKINTNKSKNKGESLSETILLILATGLLVCLLAVYLIGEARHDQIQELKRTAVKLGHAEYIIVDLNGKTEFRWITNKSNISTNLVE